MVINTVLYFYLIYICVRTRALGYQVFNTHTHTHTNQLHVHTVDIRDVVHFIKHIFIFNAVVSYRDFKNKHQIHAPPPFHLPPPLPHHSTFVSCHLFRCLPFKTTQLSLNTFATHTHTHTHTHTDILTVGYIHFNIFIFIEVLQN